MIVSRKPKAGHVIIHSAENGSMIDISTPACIIHSHFHSTSYHAVRRVNGQVLLVVIRQVPRDALRAYCLSITNHHYLS